MLHSWMAGLAGGLVLGSAAASLLVIHGRVLGVSGIVGGLVDGTERSRRSESVALIAGMALIPALAVVLTGQDTRTGITTNPALLLAGGLLVGLGTRLALGCTSGHGVCGVARLSRRGIAATLIFLSAGFIAMALLRGLLGLI